MTVNCIDGETLAAWSAGSLQRAEAAEVEVHLADCARCQAMLAAFARTEPVAPAAVPWWRRWEVRWLVPIATAATVAGIWVAIPGRDQSADVQMAPAQAEYAPSPRAGSTAAQAGAGAGAGGAGGAATDRLPGPVEGRRSVPPAGAPQKRERTQASGALGPALAEPARPSRGVAAGGVPSGGLADALPPPAAPAPKAPPPPAAATEMARVAPAAPAAPPPVVAPAAAEPKMAETPALRMAAVEVVSPGGGSRWRLTGGSRVERSIDGGTRWEAVAIPAGAVLTGGHAPDATVAWLIGRGGAIVVTTDGSTFVRVPFPDTADLVAVSATSDREATVRTADGRTFRTTDRGVTWLAP